MDGLVVECDAGFRFNVGVVGGEEEACDCDSVTAAQPPTAGESVTAPVFQIVMFIVVCSLK